MLGTLGSGVFGCCGLGVGVGTLGSGAAVGLVTGGRLRAVSSVKILLS